LDQLLLLVLYVVLVVVSAEVSWTLVAIKAFSKVLLGMVGSGDFNGGARGDEVDFSDDF
jgi:hypothetical protein